MDDKEQRLRHARGRADEFQDRLRVRLQDLHPDDFLPRAAIQLERALGDIRVMRKWPAHHLLHAMEANCAYHRHYRREAVTEDSLAKVINTYHEHHDPFSEYSLEGNGTIEGVEVFLKATARQQFELQRTWGGDDLARGLLLFDGGRFPRSHALFIEAFGVTFRDWQRFCFLLSTGLSRQPSNMVSAANFDTLAGLFSPGAIPRLLALASTDSAAVRAEYQKVRDAHALHDPFLPSILMRRPLFRRAAGDYVAPTKRLVTGHAAEGVYRIAKERWPGIFLEEFTDSFEKYVGTILSSLRGVRVLDERAIVPLSRGRRTVDFVAVGSDCLLLVECKGIEPTTRLPTLEAFRASNEVTKLSSAMGQVASTVELIREMAFAAILGDAQLLPIIAVVVTFKTMHMPNMDMYWSVIGEAVRASTGEQKLAYRPQVMDVWVLEKFVAASLLSAKTPIGMFRDKLEKPMTVTGDWSSYLQKQVTQGFMLPPLRAALDLWTSDARAAIASIREQSSSGQPSH